MIRLITAASPAADSFATRGRLAAEIHVFSERQPQGIATAIHQWIGQGPPFPRLDRRAARQQQNGARQ